jgi:magnesium-transporting ATPase (P-type)
MDKREEKVNDTYEEIETNLKLLGATAIEDKLQDGVPQCIERLARAGIKIWVLTGDKVGKFISIKFLFRFFSILLILETAYNIGLSCRLLTNDMEIQIIEEESENDVAAKLDEVRNEMIKKIEQLFDVKIEDKKKRLDWKDWGIDVMKFDQYRKNDQNGKTQRANGHAATTMEAGPQEREQFEGFGLLITGQALVFALSDNLKMKFLELGTMCKAVVCCRVTPLQKAQVVELVMQNEKKITLAIGDGANDVSMIQSKIEKKKTFFFYYFLN